MNVQHPERSKAASLHALEGGWSPGRGRGLKRPVRGLMAVALVLASLLATQAGAETAKKHDPQYRRPQPAPSYYHDAPRYSPPPVVHHRTTHVPSARSYRYAPQDRGYPTRLHEPLRSARAARRPYFVPGHAIPPAYRRHVGLLPPHLSHRLPPPPRGYRVGYYQGYSVVYDPLTFTVLSVLDLLTH